MLIKPWVSHVVVVVVVVVQTCWQCLNGRPTSVLFDAAPKSLAGSHHWNKQVPKHSQVLCTQNAKIHSCGQLVCYTLYSTSFLPCVLAPPLEFILEKITLWSRLSTLFLPLMPTCVCWDRFPNPFCEIAFQLVCYTVGPPCCDCSTRLQSTSFKIDGFTQPPHPVQHVVKPIPIPKSMPTDSKNPPCEIDSSLCLSLISPSFCWEGFPCSEIAFRLVCYTVGPPCCYCSTRLQSTLFKIDIFMPFGAAPKSFADSSPCFLVAACCQTHSQIDSKDLLRK